MSLMASRWRLHYLLNRLFRRKSKKTQISASLAFVRGLHRWPVDSPYGFPLQRASNVENVFICRHHHVLCVLTGDGNVFWICSSSKWAVPSVSWQWVHVRNQLFEYPKMSDAHHAWNTFGHFMPVTVHVSHWYQSHNIMCEINVSYEYLVSYEHLRLLGLCFLTIFSQYVNTWIMSYWFSHISIRIFSNPSNIPTSMKIRTITTANTIKSDRRSLIVAWIFCDICNAAYEHQLYSIVFSLMTVSNFEKLKNSEPPCTSIFELKHLSITQIVAIALSWLSCWEIRKFRYHFL